MKSFFKKTNFKWSLLAVFVLLMPSAIYAINVVSEGYRINKYGNSATITAHGVCAVPLNNSANDYFVPTASPGEWSSFRSSPPGGVSIGACGPVVNCVGSFQDNGAAAISYYQLGSGVGCPSYSGSQLSQCGSDTGRFYYTDNYPQVYVVSTAASNGGSACPYANGTVQGYRIAVRGPFGSFLAGTLVTLSDGTNKNVEDIQVGDIVRGYSADNSVVQLKPRFHKGNVYGINGKKVFATGSHPFRTLAGWKSFDEKQGKELHPELDIHVLQIGDTLVRANGETELIESISYTYMEVKVYNFEVTGERDYFADGYSVHNK